MKTQGIRPAPQVVCVWHRAGVQEVNNLRRHGTDYMKKYSIGSRIFPDTVPLNVNDQLFHGRPRVCFLLQVFHEGINIFRPSELLCTYLLAFPYKSCA
jgi:hypothetical protein